MKKPMIVKRNIRLSAAAVTEHYSDVVLVLALYFPGVLLSYTSRCWVSVQVVLMTGVVS